LVFSFNSFSDNPLFGSRWSLGGFVGDEAGAVLPGLEGLEEVELRIGVVALTGVPVLEGS
jgi:hypothetical protein